MTRREVSLGTRSTPTPGHKEARGLARQTWCLSDVLVPSRGRVDAGRLAVNQGSATRRDNPRTGGSGKTFRVNCDIMVGMTSSAFDTVVESVRTKTPITAVYDAYPRELCPHVVGHGPAGQEQVLAYQTGGESSSGLAPPGSTRNWRCMPIDDMWQVELSSRP